jgi:hypothetical protein
MLPSPYMQVESALFFETPEQMYSRIFSVLEPQAAPPRITVEFCRFANATSKIRMHDHQLHVKIADLLEGAPAPVMEALAFILLSKLFRRKVPPVYQQRYRLYLNRRDIRRNIHLLRQARGRKFLSGPEGEVYHLEQIFEELNARYFGGLMGRPNLGWSRRPSRTTLGHYDPSHNAIIISRILDDHRVPPIAVEYVMFHEMLHLRFPVEHNGARRCVHTREFRAAEKQFEQLVQAKEALKKL